MSDKKIIKKTRRNEKGFTLQQNLTWSPIYGRAPVTREILVPPNKEEIICHLLV